MPKFKIFPIGYDPLKASGPPNEYALKIGLNWSEEETEEHLEIAKRAIIVEADKLPSEYHGYWYQEIK